MELNFSLDEIQQAAKELLLQAAGRKVFAIHGEMGAGKTTFVHALCAVLGVKDIVSSPTFSIINEYKTGTGEIVYHLDLYRLKNEQEAFQSGVEDCLYSGRYSFIEWPEKAPAVFPEGTVHVSIDITGNNIRKLEFNL